MGFNRRISSSVEPNADNVPTRHESAAAITPRDAGNADRARAVPIWAQVAIPGHHDRGLMAWGGEIVSPSAHCGDCRITCLSSRLFHLAMDHTGGPQDNWYRLHRELHAGCDTVVCARRDRHSIEHGVGQRRTLEPLGPNRCGADQRDNMVHHLDNFDGCAGGGFAKRRTIVATNCRKMTRTDGRKTP